MAEFTRSGAFRHLSGAIVTRPESPKETMRTGSVQFVVVLWLWAVLTPCAVLHADSNAPVEVQLKVDRENGLYRCGEDAVFTATVTRDDKPVETGVVTLTVKTWTENVIVEKTVPLSHGSALIRATSRAPGFVVCEAAYGTPGETGEAGARVGAGFDPTKIKAATVMPGDLDDFWQSGRKAVGKIPFDVKLTRCDNSTADVDVFKVSVANINDTRAFGYLKVPRKKKPPFPVRVSPCSAGPRPKTVPGLNKFDRSGVMTLIVGVHPYDIPPLDGSAESLAEARIEGYALIGAPDREKFYFYRAILGISRLVDYVASRPDVDPDHFVVTGQSQGGGLALILGGLDKRFTAVAACIPGMCDHASYRRGRASAWPGLIPIEVRSDPAREEEYRTFSAYFDAVNFCRRISVPTIVSAGLIDNICRPGTVYAAYNEINAPKRIFTGPNTPHGRSREYRRFFDTWLSGQLGLGEVVPLDSGEDDGGS